MTMTWKRGRQLTTLQTEENSIQYKYDSDSIRTSKIVDGVVHTYEYLDGLLMHETRGTQAYDYYYDANGQLYAVSYKLSENDTKKVYYFTHNWRGDIVGIYNGNGELKATYSYDAWGNVTAIEDSNGSAITEATDIANLNPFRYRGYYMDTETGLYYLMSRYYDPVTHRFLNADGYFQSGGSLLDSNMNAYCRNNPVNCFDPTGTYTEEELHKSEHVSHYMPSCGYCNPDVAYYRAMQVAIKRQNDRTKLFGYSHMSGHVEQIDTETSMAGFGTYYKSGGYIQSGNSSTPNSIITLTTISDDNSKFLSSVVLDFTIGSFSLGMDDIGVTVGAPIEDTFMGVEASLSLWDKGVGRIGVAGSSSSGNGVIESGSGIEFNIPLTALATVGLIVGGEYVIAGLPSAFSLFSQAQYSFSQ